MSLLIKSVSLNLSALIHVLTMRKSFVFILYFSIMLLATVSNVFGSRQSRSSIENMAQLAFDHGAKVRIQGGCSQPKPQIVYVEMSDPSKVYLPRGTILHRCSDLTGCCPHQTQTCEPISTQQVSLYFFTVTLLPNTSSHHSRRKPKQHQSIEKVTFTNHTLCGCRQSSSSMDDYNEV